LVDVGQLPGGVDRDFIAAHAEEVAVDGGGRVSAEVGDEGRDVGRVAGIGIVLLGQLAGQLAGLLFDRLSARGGVDHAGGGVGQDRVGGDTAVAVHRVGERRGQAEDAVLGGGVVGLAGGAPGGAGREIDEAPTLAALA